jgi:hypothetical protein
MYNVWLEMAAPAAAGSAAPIGVAMVAVPPAASTFVMVDPAVVKPEETHDEARGRRRVIVPDEAMLLTVLWTLLDDAVRGGATLAAWNAYTRVWPRMITRSMREKVRPPRWAVGDPCKRWPPPLLADPVNAWFCGGNPGNEQADVAEVLRAWGPWTAADAKTPMTDKELDGLTQAPALEDAMHHRLSELAAAHEFIYGYR